MRTLWTLRIRLAYAIGMCVAGVLLSVGFNVWYANRLSKNLCDVVSVSNDAYKQAPAGSLSPTGEKLRVKMAELYDKLGC